MLSSPHASATCVLAPHAPRLAAGRHGRVRPSHQARAARRAAGAARAVQALSRRRDPRGVPRARALARTSKTWCRRRSSSCFARSRSYQGSAKFSTWLYRVVTNVARMHVRRRERSRPRARRRGHGTLESRSSPEARPGRGRRAQRAACARSTATSSSSASASARCSCCTTSRGCPRPRSRRSSERPCSPCARGCSTRARSSTRRWLPIPRWPSSVRALMPAAALAEGDGG